MPILEQTVTLSAKPDLGGAQFASHVWLEPMVSHFSLEADVLPVLTVYRSCSAL